MVSNKWYNEAKPILDYIVCPIGIIYFMGVVHQPLRNTVLPDEEGIKEVLKKGDYAQHSAEKHDCSYYGQCPLFLNFF